MKALLKECFLKEKIEYYAVLDYTECRVTNPRLAEKMRFSARSAILFLLPYFVDQPTNFSAYAASLDYHLAVSEITGRIIDSLSSEYPEYKYLGFGDHSPIDERHAALIAGLGVLGENRLLINEKYGSYVFIAEILTDAPCELLGVQKGLPVSHCAGCGACKNACPTGALRSECAECLSAITQRKGALAVREEEIMRRVGTVWGCDECQRHCPHNKSVNKTPIDFFYRDRIDTLDEVYLDSLAEQEFKVRAFAWRGERTVRRNILALFTGNDGK